MTSHSKRDECGQVEGTGELRGSERSPPLQAAPLLATRRRRNEKAVRQHDRLEEQFRSKLDDPGALRAQDAAEAR